jgi:monovalent cation:proton antiporter-2 (CPA2) family protein
MLEGGVGRELLIVLAIAGVVVPIFSRLRFGVVPGFLIAGMIFGPAGLGRLAGDFPWLTYITFTDGDRVEPFAELGVLFLLFLIGLEFSFDRLWAMRRLVFGLGALQVLVSAVLIFGAAMLIAEGVEAAVVIALAFALSSTAIVTQVLIEARRFATVTGRATLGVLIFQDLMVVPIVIVIGLMSGGEGAVSGAVLSAIGIGIGAIAGILILGRFLVRPLLRLAGAAGSRELIVAISLFLAIGTALVTSEAGLSPALGAFLAGLLLAESEYRHQIEVDIEPFKGLLLGLFFITVGMSFDLAALTVGPLAMIGAVLALLVAKAAVMFVAARLMGIEARSAIELALLIAGAGEFSLVVFSLAAREDLLAASTAQFVVSVAALSMVAIPALAALGWRVGDALSRRKGERDHGVEASDESYSDHVVIGGFGRVGQMVAKLLDSEGIEWVALDLEADLVAEEREKGKAIFFGDASRHEIIEKIGGANARCFVVTTDDPEASAKMVEAIKAKWPAARIHARATDIAQAEKLLAMGVADAIPETLEASLQLSGQVLLGIGLPSDVVDSRIDQVRDAEIRRLREGKA